MSDNNKTETLAEKPESDGTSNVTKTSRKPRAARTNKTSANNKPTPPKNDKAEAVSKDASEESNSKNKTTLIVAVIALIIAILLPSVLYWQLQQSEINAQSLNLDLRQGLAEDAAKQQAEITQLRALLGEQSNQQALAEEKIQTLSLSQEQSAQQRLDVEQKLAQLNIQDINHWRLNEAEYLIQLASKKLILEQDAASASTLLKQADSSVAAVNDPQLLPLRRAIAKDLQAIAALPFVDSLGVVLEIDSLMDGIEALQLSQIDLPEIEAQQDLNVSASADDWQSNLSKSWRSFTENFVTVRRRDGEVEALVSPQHAWYLRENLRMQLQQAQLALYRDEAELFQTNLVRAATWVEQYYQQNAHAKALVQKLNELSTQDVTAVVPDSFASLDIVQKQIRERKLRLISLSEE
ncbi:uroporphyrinogen-III C-methyltransferase [Alginatibacterium sediminis]|nr:uroporphyrinogen-III C-methyltransferase [Alginatibacterium sediminis]